MNYPYPEKTPKYFSEDDYMRVGSDTDCTGLIPSAPNSDEELENYNELYGFLPEIPEESKRPHG